MDIDAYRRKRLKELVDKDAGGNVAEFARQHAQDATRLRQMLNKNYRDGKGFKERAARRLELELGLPDLYFDLGIEDEILGRNSVTAQISNRGVNTPLIDGEQKLSSANLDSTTNTEPGPEDQGTYPLISWAQAGAWDAIVNNFARGDAEKWLDSPANVSEKSFYLRVAGESMYDPADHRSFREGELILVDPKRVAENGSFVVVRLNGSPDATFRQLIVEGGKEYLKALNPTWPNRIFEINGSAVICGVVKTKIVDY
jgi:SOS-response transcriptional repressor LexA